VQRRPCGQRFAELSAGRVALRVVAHDGLDGAAALLDKPGRCAPQRRRHRGRGFAGVDLAVDQAGVVVDDADDLDLAGVAGLVALGAVAVRPVPGPVELWELHGVDVQQRSSFGPLIAPRGRRPFGPTLAARAVALEDLPTR